MKEILTLSHCKVTNEINLHPLKILNCNALSFEKFCKQNYTYLPSNGP